MCNSTNRELDENIYRKIPSLQFLYEVNFHGKVRNVKSKRVLKQCKTCRNYWIVNVSIKGKMVCRTVHSLVAECWIGPRPEDTKIDHIDRNENNNRADNLRYVPHKEIFDNRKFSYSVGVKISNEQETLTFKSSKECADYIANKTGKAWGGIRNRLYKRRSYIHGYNIEYIV